MRLRAQISGTLALALFALSATATRADEKELWFRNTERRWLARELRARGFDCPEIRTGFQVGSSPEGNQIRLICGTPDSHAGESPMFRLVARSSGITRLEPWEPLTVLLAGLRASLD